MKRTIEEPGMLNLRAADVSGQKMAEVNGVARDATVGELIQGLLAEMHLPRNDASGVPLSYQARLEREGRHLRGSEVVGDALQEDDRIVLAPNIDAGAA